VHSAANTLFLSQVRRSRRLGLPTRLSPRARHHPSLPRPELQLYVPLLSSPFIYPPVHPAPPLTPSPNLRLPPLVAVYLGSLAALSSSSLPSAAGATIAFLAIFTPGLILHTGFMGLWRTLRRYRWFTSCLRGINATAVGLVYTAVYRLWEIGYLSKDNQDGSSLGGEPWWVVVTATSFVGGMWFGVSPPVAILLGGAMGMIWYGVVSA
jgi:hypothetical protein